MDFDLCILGFFCLYELGDLLAFDAEVLGGLAGGFEGGERGLECFCGRGVAVRVDCDLLRKAVGEARDKEGDGCGF